MTVVNGQNVTVSWPAVSTCCRSRLVLGGIWLSGSASDSYRVVGYSAALVGRLLLAAVVEVGGEGGDGFGTLVWCSGRGCGGHGGGFWLGAALPTPPASPRWVREEWRSWWRVHPLLASLKAVHARS